MSTSDYSPDQLDGVLSARCGNYPRWCNGCEQRTDLCRCGQAERDAQREQEQEQWRNAGNL